LKSIIDHLYDDFNTARELILALARYVNEERLCETDQICIIIKRMLEDKIKEGKISPRWIEDCLPKEYKRKYAKSELTSHLATGGINQTSAGQQIVQEVQGNQSIADSHGNNNDEAINKKYQLDAEDENGDLRRENADLKEALLKARTFRNALNLERKFEVHKDKLIEIIDRLKNCGQKCYLIFNEEGNLVRIEADNLKSGFDSEH
jgi:hypothetical protein